jgi:serine/threonine-protein kinase
MVAGQVPFDGPTNNDIMLRHLEDPLPDIRELRPGTSAALARVVTKLMAKKTSDRYDSTSHLVEDLDCMLKDREPLYATAENVELPSRHVQKSGCFGAGIFAFVVAAIVNWCNSR